MSEAQVKATPCKAVNDLVDSLFEHLPEYDVQEKYWKRRCADLIQSHQPLRDLLDMAEAVVNAIEPKHPGSVASRLKSALEPWKPK